MKMPTREGLNIFLRGIGFRKFKVKEERWLATVTISGLGRFRKPTTQELRTIYAAKPIWLEIKLERKIFGFKLWEVNVGSVQVTFQITYDEPNKGDKP